VRKPTSVAGSAYFRREKHVFPDTAVFSRAWDDRVAIAKKPGRVGVAAKISLSFAVSG
jgi:hypothetical protein